MSKKKSKKKTKRTYTAVQDIEKLLARICEIINLKRFIASLAGLLYNDIMKKPNGGSIHG